MPSVINSTTTGLGGLISTGDTDNALNIQTGDTTAISIDSSQVVTFANAIASVTLTSPTINSPTINTATINTSTINTTTLNAPVVNGLKETKVAIAASNIDLSAGNYFTKTISASTTFTVSNVASSGTVSAFVLELTNGGSDTVAYFSGVTWPGGIAPVLSVSGVDVLAFFTTDGGTTWRGFTLGLAMAAP